MADSWILSREVLESSPSWQDGVPAEKECRSRYDAFRYIEELQKALELCVSSERSISIVFLAFSGASFLSRLRLYSSSCKSQAAADHQHGGGVYA